MPFPATRYTLPNVGATRSERPHSFACAYAQVGCLLWRGEFGYWQAGHCLRTEIQRGFIRELSEVATQASAAQQTPSRNTGQRQIPPRARVALLSASIPQPTHTTISSSVQPRTQSDRARLEAGTLVGHPQPALRVTGRRSQRCARTFRDLGEAQSATGKIMRHYLGRYV